MIKNKQLIGFSIIILFLSGVFYLGLKRALPQNKLMFHDAVGKAYVEEQLKFDVPDISVFEKLKRMDNVLNYRLKTQGTYIYQDYYYDTPDLDLFKLGYLYRLRIRDKEDNIPEYGLQFKKEFDEKNNKDSIRDEIDDILPEELAKNTLSGNWQEVFSAKYDLLTIKKIDSFLKANNLDYSRLVPLLICRQERLRLRLRERSVVYFEISLDKVRFNLVNDGSKQIEFMQLEFENKLKGSIGRDNDRIGKLAKFFESEYKLTPSRESKYRKAVLELIKK